MGYTVYTPIVGLSWGRRCDTDLDLPLRAFIMRHPRVVLNDARLERRFCAK